MKIFIKKEKSKYQKEPKETTKLLIFSGNPSQYHAPLFRKINKALNGKMFVMFGGSFGIEPFYNPEVSSIIKWDIPIIGGYPFKVYRSLSSEKWRNFFRWNNPGMIFTVIFSKAPFVLIHGYNSLSAIYVYLAALISRKKIIFRGEAIEKIHRRKSFTNFLKEIILYFYFLGTYKVLFSCTKNCQYLKKFLLGKNYKLVSFPCAVDNYFFRSRKINKNKKKQLKEDLGIPKDHVIIATCSRITKRKRINLLLKALKLLNKKVTVLLIGDGPERLNLEKQAKNLKLNLIITGFVGQKKVAEFLSISDIFTILSIYDASPKALNEAINFSIPIIASEGVGTSEDLVINGVNGYIYRENEYDLLSKNLEFLILNKKKRKEMGGKNKHIINKYTLEKDVLNLMQIINE